MIHLSSTRTPVETLESTPASARVPTACLTLDCIQNGFAHTVVCSTFAHVRDDILLLNVDVVLSSVDGFDPGRVVGNIIPHRHETMAPSNERPGISGTAPDSCRGGIQVLHLLVKERLFIGSDKVPAFDEVLSDILCR